MKVQQRKSCRPRPLQPKAESVDQPGQQQTGLQIHNSSAAEPGSGPGGQSEQRPTRRNVQQQQLGTRRRTRSSGTSYNEIDGVEGVHEEDPDFVVNDNSDDSDFV